MDQAEPVWKKENHHGSCRETKYVYDQVSTKGHI